VAEVSVRETVDAYIGALPGAARRLADGEWGLTLSPESAGGWPLDIGIRIAEGLLRVQAYACPAAHALPDAELLHWNRNTRIVRFARTGDGDIWIQADLPEAAVDAAELDRLLGLVVETATELRAAATAEAAEPGGGWLKPKSA
jgi:hypothetical protein